MEKIRIASRGFSAVAFATIAVAATGFAQAPKNEAIGKARVLWQTGKYAEAREAYDALVKDPKIAADPKLRARLFLDRADCLSSQGETDRALVEIKELAETAKTDADLWAKLGELQFSRGLWEDARRSAAASVKIKADNLQARWTLARLLAAQGEIEKANEAYQWFIQYHNEHKKELRDDASALLIVGQASELYARAKARGEDLKESLLDVVEELYERALEADPNCWQAPWLEGRLYLSGYNESAGSRELSRAIEINPQSPEVLVTRGEADLRGYNLSAARKKARNALEINPRYAPAFVLLADAAIADERFEDALSSSRKAVLENPKDEEALARLAASYRLLVDPLGASAVEAVARANNPNPSTFYAALGERLADRRKYHSAERAFLLAVEADPDSAGPRIGLGMLYMQIGREAEARDLFDAAFEADPFNVRANNMIEVLKHLTEYSSAKTDHYEVLSLAGRDELLGKYMSRFLESVHDELTSRFGFSPPGLTKIEIMKDHRWFSARTTGLPFIPTVGACTGKVVAMSSPKSTNKPYNWARVLKHEVTHVITLQQTDFNIPHWFTEALAVESEASPRPQAWNKLLLERVPKRADLLDLDSINLGFIRPKDADQRQLAYCQAQLYAQYMLKRFGATAIVKMLAAYRRGLTTDKAIAECFRVDKADFEKKYLDFLDETVKTIRVRTEEESPTSFSKLERELKAKPDDADLNAKVAYEYYARRDLREAREYADKALKLKEHHPLASWIKARLLESIGDKTAALELLKPALDESKPDERVLDLMGLLELDAGRLDEAEALYELGRRDDPLSTKWLAGLARVHLRQGKTEKFLADLAKIADNEADELTVRQTLAKRHLAAGDYDKARKWALECLYIQVYDPNAHVVLADALTGLKKYEEALEEYQTAIELRVKRPDAVRVKTATVLDALGKRDEARAVLDSILKRDPKQPEAKQLLEEWNKTDSKPKGED